MLDMYEIKSLVKRVMCKVRTVTNKKFISNYVSSVKYYSRECGIERKYLIEKKRWNELQGSPFSWVSVSVFSFLVLHIGIGGGFSVWIYLFNSADVLFTVENLAGILDIVGFLWALLMVLIWWSNPRSRFASVTVAVLFVVSKFSVDDAFGEFELIVQAVIMFAVIMFAERYLIIGYYKRKYLDNFKFSGGYKYTIR